MIIRNLREAEEILSTYIPASGQLSIKNMTLTNVRSLLKSLGNPQSKLKIVHIAGTSGKTSTAYYMSALLKEAGQQVGLTVSPHVDSLTERIQINGRPMAESDFCDELGRFIDTVNRAGVKPSYFELLYAFVIWALSERGIDYAVIETGLGGKLDATNVADRPDKVCVITDIGLDHQEVLGNTLPEIADQKIGIVHDQNHVFMYEQGPEVMAVIKRHIDDHNAHLHIVETDNQVNDNMPAYQQRNWNLAYAVYEYLRQRDNLPHLSQALAKSRQIAVPGRMEVTRINGKTLVMDGAHNVQKIQAFINSFKRLYPAAKPAILLSLKAGKEYEEVLPLLKPLAGRIIVTAFETSQDLPIKSMDPAKLAAALSDAGFTNIEAPPDSHAALQSLLSGPEETCVITGSFYLLGQIRNDKLLK